MEERSKILLDDEVPLEMLFIYSLLERRGVEYRMVGEGRIGKQSKGM